MAESKIIIQVLLDDKASDPLKKVESGLSGVNEETKKFNEHEKERERLQQRIIKATSKENIELKQLELRLQMANKRATETAKARINAAEGQDMFAKSVSRTTGALKGNRAQSGLNNAILIELGRTASDSQYGFQGMANNIGRLVELGQEFTRTGGGGILNALKTLGKSILGGGGILIGIQLLISFLPKLQQKFKEASTGAGVLGDSLKKAGESAASTVRELDDLLSIISDSSSTTFEYDTAVQQLEKNFPKLIKQLNVAGYSIEDLKEQTEGATKITESYREEVIKLARAKAILAVIDELYAERIRLQLEMDMALIEAEKTSSTERIRFITKSGQAVYKTEEELDEARRKRVEKVRKDYDKDLKDIDDKIQQASKYIDEPLKKLDDFQTESVLTFKSVGVQRVTSDNEVTATILSNSEKRIQQSEKEKRRVIRAIREKQKMELAYANTLANLGNFLSALGEKSKGLAIAGIIADKAANVAKIISNTQAANAIARVLSPLTLGQPFVTLNNISAGLGIATSVLGARNAIQEINSDQLSSSAPKPSSGGGGTFQAPDFNIVGASGQSQLAQTIAGAEAQPVRAYVVGKDVSTQQELDRNITNTASFG